MKKKLYLTICSALGLCVLGAGQGALAASYPSGNLMIYNASNDDITAQVSTSAYGEFNLASRESKTVAYSSLLQVCAANPTNCKAHFYINNSPAGSATINVVAGKLVSWYLPSKKLLVSHGPAQILRSVVIK